MNRPKLSREEVEKIISRNGIDREKYPVVCVSIRGYYLDSMGKPGVNDRNIFDDAIFWVTPDFFESYNANNDPSRYQKHIATLKLGIWLYQPGPHPFKKPNYPAFRQAANVWVSRDGEKDEKGDFGINLHKGGVISTGSAGCQTILPAQWEDFRDDGYAQLKKFGQKTFPYILISEEERRKLYV